MAIERQLIGTVEIRTGDSGGVWVADIEAQGGSHLRARLRLDDMSAMPAWEQGTTVECCMIGAEGRYLAQAVVLKQIDDTVWLGIPAVWTPDHDQRQQPRIVADFPVSFVTPDAIGVGLCCNINAGGMRLVSPFSLPAHTRLTLTFDLPDDGGRICTAATVIYLSPTEEHSEDRFEVGVKFVGLSPSDGTRIANYARAAAAPV